MSELKAFFSEEHVLHELKHYLPNQAPLKDFIHHNTLHSFQEYPFEEALRRARLAFGYRVYRPLAEYRKTFFEGRFSESVLEDVIQNHFGAALMEDWRRNLLYKAYDTSSTSSVGNLRAHWKSDHKLNMDKETHPILFRWVSSFLDQGIGFAGFPYKDLSLIEAMRKLDSNSFQGVFKNSTTRSLLQSVTSLKPLLRLVVGVREDLYECYLFDQQFAHPGWSGMVAVLETTSGSLLDRRKISLKDFITLELLLEVDALISKFGERFPDVSARLEDFNNDYFIDRPDDEYMKVLSLWQEVSEWNYYDQVLLGMSRPQAIASYPVPSFQSIFCIDDRECSFRRYLENEDPACQTFGTAGFFGLDLSFKPEHGLFDTKSCPAPITPSTVILESESEKRHRKDNHFHHGSYSLLGGWLLSQTMGFWSALKLTASIFYPTETKSMVSSFKHMDKEGKLTFKFDEKQSREGFKVGYTSTEMADKMAALLYSIGLVEGFAPVVYIVGHGASSMNNTHYAGYDCGACSGRPGSVNARVAAAMLNMAEVRFLLIERDIIIPKETVFIGALHDTTKDEIEFYDEATLGEIEKNRHFNCKSVFEKALRKNARERSRRFLLIDSHRKETSVHRLVKKRAMSLFEPRPEWNHATNALCIVGRRSTNRHLFLDRRAFLNSFDYRLDTEGKYLTGILNAVAPVCGGINLEYYFSRVDNYRLGAGTKLPHNVIGLIGVANGMDGDLRTGLPAQMINIHEPLRLLVIVEHEPQIVLNVLQANPVTKQWFYNEWIHLACLNPLDGKIYIYKHHVFKEYKFCANHISRLDSLEAIRIEEHDNLPVSYLEAQP